MAAGSRAAESGKLSRDVYGLKETALACMQRVKSNQLKPADMHLSLFYLFM
jgi:hypothetical protein